MQQSCHSAQLFPACCAMLLIIELAPSVEDEEAEDEAGFGER